ncbi:MAG: flagellar protein FliT [Rubrivivax sp.]|nr:flagellar protein FliT [Rubrivivax sp.]
MDPQLLTYYEAIERASADMLNAARAGNWDEVVKLEGACVLLISQLKHAAQEPPPYGAAEPTSFEVPPPGALPPAPALAGAAASPRERAQVAGDAARAKARIMQRILMNDAEIRQLAEPWLQTLDEAMQGRRRTLH